MIPKKIHYCWFGRKELPEKAKKCIASWKKYCPDFEIIEWNEDNFDVIKMHMEGCQSFGGSSMESLRMFSPPIPVTAIEILAPCRWLFWNTDIQISRCIERQNRNR